MCPHISNLSQRHDELKLQKYHPTHPTPRKSNPHKPHLARVIKLHRRHTATGLPLRRTDTNRRHKGLEQEKQKNNYGEMQH